MDDPNVTPTRADDDLPMEEQREPDEEKPPTSSSPHQSATRSTEDTVPEQQADYDDEREGNDDCENVEDVDYGGDTPDDDYDNIESDHGSDSWITVDQIPSYSGQNRESRKRRRDTKQADLDGMG